MAEFKLKPVIFDYFPPLYFIDDINKDAESKGTNQRFQEMLADDWDINMLPFVEGLVDTIYSENLPDKFVPYMEYFLGLKNPLVEDMTVRKKIIKYLPKIYKIKGTLPSYQILFKVLGFTSVEIEEIENEDMSFDSIVLFDDVQRIFDKNECQTCSKYILKLEGSFPLTEDLYNLIINTVKLVEPINAKLYVIKYNTVDVSFTIFVAPNGDLIYSIIGIQVSFLLSENGDLWITAEDAQNYFLNNGNLFKNGY